MEAKPLEAVPASPGTIRPYAELEELLYRIFEYRQLNRKAEIERIEKKLEELKKENQLRLEKKDEMVQRQLNKLLGIRSDLEW